MSFEGNYHAALKRIVELETALESIADIGIGEKHLHEARLFGVIECARRALGYTKDAANCACRGTDREDGLHERHCPCFKSDALDGHGSGA